MLRLSRAIDRELSVYEPELARKQYQITQYFEMAKLPTVTRRGSSSSSEDSGYHADVSAKKLDSGYHTDVSAKKLNSGYHADVSAVTSDNDSDGKDSTSSKRKSSSDDVTCNPSGSATGNASSANHAQSDYSSKVFIGGIPPHVGLGKLSHFTFIK